jgi:type II secretory pathway pseudopilin PulG
MIKRTTAFSLLETLLAVFLMAMIVAVPFTINSSLLFRIQAEGAQSQVGHALRTAELLAEQSKLDDSWGVHVQAQSITIFKGSNYAARDTAYDDIYEYDDKVSLSVTSGSSTVYFAKRTGIPSGNMSVAIVAEGGGTKTVSFTTNGAITYN